MKVPSGGTAEVWCQERTTVMLEGPAHRQLQLVNIGGSGMVGDRAELPSCHLTSVLNYERRT